MSMAPTDQLEDRAANDNDSCLVPEDEVPFVQRTDSNSDAFTRLIEAFNAYTDVCKAALQSLGDEIKLKRVRSDII